MQLEPSDEIGALHLTPSSVARKTLNRNFVRRFMEPDPYLGNRLPCQGRT